MALRAHHQALLRNALDAAARGWHVFPLRPDDKRPAFPDHSAARCALADPRCRAAGRHVRWEERATTDPGRIRRAWSLRAFNIGIACGPSRLVVVDLDTPKPDAIRPPVWDLPGVDTGREVFALLCARAGQPVPTGTYTVTTGRGGTHLVFQHPTSTPLLRNTSGDSGSGLGWLVDTRAGGGYVVAAGSVVDGRPYTVVDDRDPMVLPRWLADRLTQAVPVPAGPQTPPRPVALRQGTGRKAAYLQSALDRQAGYVAAARSQRNHTLFIAAQNLGQLVAGGDLDETTVEDVLTDAAHRCGLHRDPPAGQIPRTIASGLRAGARRPRSAAV